MTASAAEKPGPVTLVVGEEEFLIDRTVRELLAAADAEDVHDLEGAALGAGELEALTSPSLFGGGSVVVIRSAQNILK
jgi:DNA polymerase III subunit delta